MRGRASRGRPNLASQAGWSKGGWSAPQSQDTPRLEAVSFQPPNIRSSSAIRRSRMRSSGSSSISIRASASHRPSDRL
jgi:hypothetical protein